MNAENEDKMLPYIVIARMCGLHKEKPNNPDDMVWLDDKERRYVLTPKGFVDAVQYNNKVVADKIQEELTKAIGTYVELKEKFDKHKETCPSFSKPDGVSKKSKKKIITLINSNNYRTIEEKFEAVKKYLKT